MPVILAVDDSPSMRKMVSFTLTGAGYQVVEAVDGQDAFEKAQTQSFDLVLTDQNMPRLDGLGLTRKLREQDHDNAVTLTRQPLIQLLRRLDRAGHRRATPTG